MNEKFKSRTFWLTVTWTSFVPISVIIQIFTKVELPIESIVQISGLLSIAYVTGNKLNNMVKKKEA